MREEEEDIIDILLYKLYEPYKLYKLFIQRFPQGLRLTASALQLQIPLAARGTLLCSTRLQSYSLHLPEKFLFA
jgi:hypothetical protein